MNDFFKIADKYLKPVTIGAGVVFLLFAASTHFSRSMQALFHSRTLSRHTHSHRLRLHHRVKSSVLLAAEKFQPAISSALTAETR
nr:hypothetical protein [uncultured Ruminococcus sp.]